ncbi:MAG: outer membrane beta-barrel protein [Chitinispirillaceae bacterium]|nr:outer membrane beta-barrel protein [Chitinispirillaceae bacterium]
MRKVYAAVMVVSMISLAAAQKLEVGISGGYGLPAGTILVGHKTIIDTSTYTPKTFEEVYSPGGMGWKMTGEVVYYPFENIGIIAIGGYSTGNRYDTIYSYENNTNMVADTVTTAHIPLNIGLKIKTKVWILEPYLYVAPGVVFPRKTENSFDSALSVTIKKTYSYSMGFSVTAGLGAAIMVTKKMGIKVEFAPTYAFASPTRFEEERTQGGITTTRTVKYVINKPISLLLPDETQNQPHDSFCSMAFRIGLSYTLF